MIPKVPFLRFLCRSNSILKNPLPFHKENFEKHGDIFQMQLGSNKSVVFTRSPQLIQHILRINQKNYYKSPLQTDDLGKYIGMGLLTVNDEY